MTINNLQGQEAISPESSGAVAVSSDIYHLVGTKTGTLLSKPTGVYQHLVLVAEAQAWRIRIGDYHASGMPGVVIPAADVSNGTGSLPLAEGRSIVLPAANRVTVSSYDAAAILTYYWV